MEPIGAYQYDVLARQRVAEASRRAHQVRQARDLRRARSASTADGPAGIERRVRTRRTRSPRRWWRVRWHQPTRPRAV